VQDMIIKLELPSTVRIALLLMGMVFLFCLNGCASKNTVTYIPHDEPSEPMPQLNLRPAVTEDLREYFSSWQGTRYRYGGLSRKGVDCSGFTLLTYRELFGKNLPRTVKGQVKKGTKISKSSLQAGDLVFFKTGLLQKHVGIYLEDDLFIHASRSKGVMISNMKDIYWQARYWQAQRLYPEAELGNCLQRYYSKM